MWKITFGMVALLVGLVLVLRPEKLPAGTLPVFGAGSVQGEARVGGHACAAERCLIIYVAPWCPTCRRLNDALVALRQQVEADGIPVSFIVGMDKPPQLMAYARAYTQPVMLDHQRYHKQARVKAVPYLAVVDRIGRVQAKMYGGAYDVAYMRQELGLDRR